MLKFRQFMREDATNFWTDIFENYDVIELFNHVHMTIAAQRVGYPLLQAYDRMFVERAVPGDITTFQPVSVRVPPPTEIETATDYPIKFLLDSEDWLWIDTLQDRYTDPNRIYQLEVDFMMGAPGEIWARSYVRFVDAIIDRAPVSAYVGRLNNTYNFFVETGNPQFKQTCILGAFIDLYNPEYVGSVRIYEVTSDSHVRVQKKAYRRGPTGYDAIAEDIPSEWLNHEYTFGIAVIQNEQDWIVGKGAKRGFGLSVAAGVMLGLQREDTFDYRDMLTPLSAMFYMQPTHKLLAAGINTAIDNPVSKFGDELIYTMVESRLPIEIYPYHLNNGYVYTNQDRYLLGGAASLKKRVLFDATSPTLGVGSIIGETINSDLYPAHWPPKKNYLRFEPFADAAFIVGEDYTLTGKPGYSPLGSQWWQQSYPNGVRIFDQRMFQKYFCDKNIYDDLISRAVVDEYMEMYGKYYCAIAFVEYDNLDMDTTNHTIEQDIYNLVLDATPLLTDLVLVAHLTIHDWLEELVAFPPNDDGSIYDVWVDSDRVWPINKKGQRDPLGYVPAGYVDHPTIKHAPEQGKPGVYEWAIGGGDPDTGKLVDDAARYAVGSYTHDAKLPDQRGPEYTHLAYEQPFVDSASNDVTDFSKAPLPANLDIVLDRVSTTTGTTLKRVYIPELTVGEARYDGLLLGHMTGTYGLLYGDNDELKLIMYLSRGDESEC